MATQSDLAVHSSLHPCSVKPVGSIANLTELAWSLQGLEIIMEMMLGILYNQLKVLTDFNYLDNVPQGQISIWFYFGALSILLTRECWFTRLGISTKVSEILCSSGPCMISQRFLVTPPPSSPNQDSGGGFCRSTETQCLRRNPMPWKRALR